MKLSVFKAVGFSVAAASASLGCSAELNSDVSEKQAATATQVPGFESLFGRYNCDTFDFDRTGFAGGAPDETVAFATDMPGDGAGSTLIYLPEGRPDVTGGQIAVSVGNSSSRGVRLSVGELDPRRMQFTSSRRAVVDRIGSATIDCRVEALTLARIEPGTGVSEDELAVTAAVTCSNMDTVYFRNCNSTGGR